MAAQRDDKGRFQKGCSGNPKGRPKADPEVKQILKAAGVDAARVLVAMMHDPEVKRETRIDCALKILERVCGKPNQPLDTQVDGTVRFILEGELSEYAK